MENITRNYRIVSYKDAKKSVRYTGGSYAFTEKAFNDALASGADWAAIEVVEIQTPPTGTAEWKVIKRAYKITANEKV